MRRWGAGWVAGVMALASTALRADVTVVQVITVEGQAIAASGQTLAPRITMRIKGTKARVDMESDQSTVTSLVDQATGQVFTLNPADKTATLTEAARGGTPEAAAQAAAAQAPKPEVTVKPTGKVRTIDGVACDDYALRARLNMGDVLGPAMQVPPEAAAALKEVFMVMDGSSCVATGGPAVAEYMAFQKSVVKTLKTAMSAGAAGVNAGMLEQILGALTDVPGLAYHTELNISLEGGQFAMMLQQLGAMKVTTRTVSVSADPLADDLFAVPPDYKVIK